MSEDGVRNRLKLFFQSVVRFSEKLPFRDKSSINDGVPEYPPTNQSVFFQSFLRIASDIKKYFQFTVFYLQEINNIETNGHFSLFFRQVFIKS